MNYELAKQLKDAGFPKIILVCDNTDIEHMCRADMNDCVMGSLNNPTLSELIEACGDKFWSLFRTNNALGNWEATDKNNNGWINNIRVFGNTPEESVAQLWLSLNKS